MVFKYDHSHQIHPSSQGVLFGDGGESETIEMVATSSLVPPNPSINVGENETVDLRQFSIFVFYAKPFLPFSL
jgi:hypothetical protein